MNSIVKPKLGVNATRLYDTLDQLGQIGAYQDERTGLTGVCRLTLTDADRDGRHLVAGWFRKAGLDVRIDAIGNVFAQRAGRDNTRAPVMSGSHVDSVATGGRFDGALGVLAALEVMRTLDDHDIRTRRPLVAAFFTEEEGCRFATDMLGSAVATGRIALEEAYALIDRDGKSVQDELQRIGFLGAEQVGGRKPHAYVECHIEQGPVLIRSGHDLGVVTGVQGISWQEVTIQGTSAHAGTTPVEYRHDAGLAAALLNVRMREMADSGLYGELRCTMGVIQPHPGLVNVIPGRVRTTIDLRNPDDRLMAQAESHLRAYAAELAHQHGVEITWRQTAKTPTVPFHDPVQDLIEQVANELGLKTMRFIAGAGHDAQEWARLCKTGMVFIPGEYDGISHNPREYSTQKQCADGANTLLHTLLALAEEA